MKKAVCAVIRNEENKVLSIHRKNDPNKLALIGGKVEENESIESALSREVFEETGLTILDANKVHIDVVPSIQEGGFDFEVHYFKVTKWSGTPTASSEGKLEWLDDQLLIGERSAFKDSIKKVFDIIKSLEDKK